MDGMTLFRVPDDLISVESTPIQVKSERRDQNAY